MWVFPVNRERFIHLKVLACLYAPATENALIGIIAIKRVCIVDLVGLRSIGDVLAFNRQQFSGVVDGAVTVAVIAHRAVENVIAENAIKCFPLRCYRVGSFGFY